MTTTLLLHTWILVIKVPRSLLKVSQHLPVYRLEKMKRNQFKTFWFLFKLTLLFNVYFHHKVTAVSSIISKNKTIVYFKFVYDKNLNQIEINPGPEESKNFFDRKERPARLLPLKYSL